jgi:hypothetical protein
MFRVRAISLRVISCSFLILVASATLLQTALSQTAIDDVHVVPREKTVDLASAAFGAASAGGYTGAALIHTSVDLVMVPVTITDNFNRPIIGLNQENFQLFDSKKAQAIKHFSNETRRFRWGFWWTPASMNSSSTGRARRWRNLRRGQPAG